MLCRSFLGNIQIHTYTRTHILSFVHIKCFSCALSLCVNVHMCVCLCMPSKGAEELWVSRIRSGWLSGRQMTWGTCLVFTTSVFAPRYSAFILCSQFPFNFIIFCFLFFCYISTSSWLSCSRKLHWLTICYTQGAFCGICCNNTERTNTHTQWRQNL